MADFFLKNSAVSVCNHRALEFYHVRMVVPASLYLIVTISTQIV